MASFVLHDKAAIAQFESDVGSLVNAGHGARAIALAHRAAVDSGQTELARLIDPKTLNPLIDPPEHLLSDCAELAGLGGDGGAMCLLLHCESPSAPAERQGLIHKKAEQTAGQDMLGWHPDNSARPIRLEGLDACLPWCGNRVTQSLPRRIARCGTSSHFGRSPEVS